MDDFSFKILQLYATRSSLTLIELGAILNNDPINLAEVINYLRKQGYLHIENNYATIKNLNDNSLVGLNTPLVISFEGKAALEKEIKSRKHYCYNELRAWITLAIAILAFFLSIISLALQYI